MFKIIFQENILRDSANRFIYFLFLHESQHGSNFLWKKHAALMLSQLVQHVAFACDMTLETAESEASP
jgi:hypothetical protein